jgi:hypothetical protein
LTLTDGNLRPAISGSYHCHSSWLYSHANGQLFDRRASCQLLTARQSFSSLSATELVMYTVLAIAGTVCAGQPWRTRCFDQQPPYRRPASSCLWVPQHRMARASAGCSCGVPLAVQAASTAQYSHNTVSSKSWAVNHGRSTWHLPRGCCVTRCEARKRPAATHQHQQPSVCTA